MWLPHGDPQSSGDVVRHVTVHLGDELISALIKELIDPVGLEQFNGIRYAHVEFPGEGACYPDLHGSIVQGCELFAHSGGLRTILFQDLAGFSVRGVRVGDQSEECVGFHKPDEGGVQGDVLFL